MNTAILNKIELILEENGSDMDFVTLADKLDVTVDYLDENMFEVLDLISRVQSLETYKTFEGDMIAFNELDDSSDGYDDEGFSTYIGDERETITLGNGMIMHIEKANSYQASNRCRKI